MPVNQRRRDQQEAIIITFDITTVYLLSKIVTLSFFLIHEILQSISFLGNKPSELLPLSSAVLVPSLLIFSSVFSSRFFISPLRFLSYFTRKLAARRSTNAQWTTNFWKLKAFIYKGIYVTRFVPACYVCGYKYEKKKLAKLTRFVAEKRTRPYFFFFSRGEKRKKKREEEEER